MLWVWKICIYYKYLWQTQWLFIIIKLYQSNIGKKNNINHLKAILKYIIQIIIYRSQMAQNSGNLEFYKTFVVYIIFDWSLYSPKFLYSNFLRCNQKLSSSIGLQVPEFILTFPFLHMENQNGHTRMWINKGYSSWLQANGNCSLDKSGS